MSSLTILSATMATDDASAESVGLPDLAADPCKAKNLARKEHCRRQREREAREKLAAAKAAADAALVAAAEDMDVVVTQANPSAVGTMTNNLSSLLDSVPPSQWTDIPDLGFSQAVPNVN
jgi:hypothetical protein